MPNGNKKVETTCPRCKQTRLARGDVIRKAEREGRELFCKPCRNQARFSNKSHPTKGTGVKNDPERLPARNSYYKAQRRCRLGAKHHPAYEAVEFRFTSFDEFFALLGPKPKGCSLDRIDPLGHYEPGNVRWATNAEQTANRLPRGYWVNGYVSNQSAQTDDRGPQTHEAADADGKVSPAQSPGRSCRMTVEEKNTNQSAQRVMFGWRY